MFIKERFIPIQVDQERCGYCERCLRVCKNDAISFDHGLRLVDYHKCKGCLDCVNVCPKNIIEVTSVTSREVLTIRINHEKCSMCLECIYKNGKFCPNNLFYVGSIQVGGKEEEGIRFKFDKRLKCEGCLQCQLECPENAITPIVFDEE